MNLESTYFSDSALWEDWGAVTMVITMGILRAETVASDAISCEKEWHLLEEVSDYRSRAEIYNMSL